MKPTKLIPIGIFLLCLSTQLVLAQKCPTAQSFKKSRLTSEFSISFGGSHYFGDLNPYNHSDRRITGELHKENMSPVFSMNYRFYPSRFINPRVSLLYTRLNGSDKDNEVKNDRDASWFRQYRNLTFRTDVLELSALIEFNILGFTPGDMRKRFSPYLLAGVGVIFFDPKAPYNDDWITSQTTDAVSPVANNGNYAYNSWVRLQPLGTEGQGMPGYAEKYSLIQPNYTLGIGFKLNLTSSVTLAWEVSHHFTFTDYLDDVSTVYPDQMDFYNYYNGDKAQMAANLSARAKEMDASGDYTYIVEGGQQRGSPKFNDSYLVSMITVGYKLNKKNATSTGNPKRIQKKEDKKNAKEAEDGDQKKKRHQPKNEDYDYLNKRPAKREDGLSKL